MTKDTLNTGKDEILDNFKRFVLAEPDGLTDEQAKAQLLELSLEIMDKAEVYEFDPMAGSYGGNEWLEKEELKQAFRKGFDERRDK